MVYVFQSLARDCETYYPMEYVNLRRLGRRRGKIRKSEKESNPVVQERLLTENSCGRGRRDHFVKSISLCQRHRGRGEKVWS